MLNREELVEKLSKVSREEALKLLEEYLAESILKDKAKEQLKEEEILKSRTPLKIFDDPQLKIEISEIDFGRVEAGKSKLLTLFIQNPTPATLEDIKIVFPEEDIRKFHIEVIDFPKMVPPKGVAPFTIKWSPSLELREPLITKFKVTGVQVYSPPKK